MENKISVCKNCGDFLIYYNGNEEYEGGKHIISPEYMRILGNTGCNQPEPEELCNY